jgi:hypothetical protein
MVIGYYNLGRYQKPGTLGGLPFYGNNGSDGSLIDRGPLLGRYAI